MIGGTKWPGRGRLSAHPMLHGAEYEIGEWLYCLRYAACETDCGFFDRAGYPGLVCRVSRSAWSWHRIRYRHDWPGLEPEPRPVAAA
ncbi:hypothetical protein D3C81_1671180 [compost metagenome]